MRLATFEYNSRTMVGCVIGEEIVPLERLGSFPSSLRGFIAAGPDVWRFLQALDLSVGACVPVSNVRLLAPIPCPPNNVICLGLNYPSHIEESAASIDEDYLGGAEAIFFTKAISSINGPYDTIPFDAAVSDQIDWEVELGVVIGIGGRHISPEKALDHVFGYTVVNDISARDVQHRHKQFFLGKSLDGSCPIGPHIVTADEILDPQRLGLRTLVNGVLKQNGSTADQIFSVAQAISILSRFITLQPGDIIATGTPDGVGAGRNPQEFLKPGDVVECEIDGIGMIRNEIVAFQP